MLKANKAAGLNNIISPNIIFDFSNLDSGIYSSINFDENYVIGENILLNIWNINFQ